MSTEKLQFEVVSDELRLAPIERRKKSPLFLKLLANETVFVPTSPDVKEATLNKFYDKARNLGKKLNKRKATINDKEGFLMWFSDQETN